MHFEEEVEGVDRLTCARHLPHCPSGEHELLSEGRYSDLPDGFVMED